MGLTWERRVWYSVVKHFSKTTKGDEVDKLQTLKDARALLATGWTTGVWRDFVGLVEHFCLYGALQSAMGIKNPGRAGDQAVDACSLTTTLFDSLDPKDLNARALGLRNMARSFEYDRKPNLAMKYRRATLQAVNDDTSQETVLALIDTTIASLEARG